MTTPPVAEISTRQSPAAVRRADVAEAIRSATATPDPHRPQSGNLSVARIDYDGEGRVILRGSASPASRVRISLSGQALGEVETDANGQWRLEPKDRIAAGQYDLQVREVSAGGGTKNAVELPFAQAENIQDLPKEDRLVVQPGNNLWRLAQKIYGDGFLYPMIFEANRDQIRDPDLIYPGQIFQIPPVPTGG